MHHSKIFFLYCFIFYLVLILLPYTISARNIFILFRLFHFIYSLLSSSGWLYFISVSPQSFVDVYENIWSSFSSLFHKYQNMFMILSKRQEDNNNKFGELKKLNIIIYSIFYCTVSILLSSCVQTAIAISYWVSLQ